MKYKDFEDFLSSEFGKQNPTILDDDWVDAFDDWLATLDVQEWLDYSEEWRKTL